MQRYFTTRVFQSFQNQYPPNIESMTDAATAEPITPATFGPIACISRKFAGLSASLGVPQDYLCVGSLVVGTPAEQPEAHPVKSETMTVVA